ncbi:MAG: hypothetical protein CMJ34_13430 [Phycisphaerae bacterium]|nr:hypothetical protein [Phycisphaerae bacterium]
MPDFPVGLSVPELECAIDPVRLIKSADETARSYLNQLDNRRVGLRRLGSRVAAHAQCASTSLTMSLLALYDGDRTTMLEECRSLAAEQGQSLVDVSKEDIELAVMDLIIGTDWQRAQRRAPAFFEGRDWRPPSHSGNRIIKNPFAQAYTASRFARCGDVGVSIASRWVCIERGLVGPGLNLDQRWEWTRRQWQAGAEVSFEAAFTDRGHVVHVLEASTKELVVHDPYGLWLGGTRYIRNGTAAPRMSNRSAAAFERRSSHNLPLREQRASGRVFERWGERNLIAKQDLVAINGPAWVLAIGTGSSAVT